MKQKRTALVTGCSTGLGLATACLLAKRGFRVYATVRRLENAQKAHDAIDVDKLDVELVEVDVRNSAQVEKAAQRIREEEGRLDVLVCNAGRGFLRTVEQASEAEVQDLFDTNFMGVVRCIHSCMPMMRRQRHGHIIAISSVGGLVGQPLNEVYCASKFAVEGLLESMATYVTQEFNIHMTLVEPGGISSEFANNVMKDIAGSGGLRDDDYKGVMQRYIASAQSRAELEDTYQTPGQVAEIVCDCVDLENPPLRIRTSAWAESFCELKTKLDTTGEKLLKATSAMML